MKHIKPETCSASLLRAQWQLELLTNMMTQENLHCFEIYEEQKSQLIKQRSQALEELSCWLCRMGLQDEMLRLIQRESHKRSESSRQAKQGNQEGGAS